MKRGIIWWAIVLVVITVIVYMLFKPGVYVSCSKLTLRLAKAVMGSYKDFSYSFSFLIAAFVGWYSYKEAEKRSVKGHSPYSHLSWIIPASYLIIAVILILFYIIAMRTGWFSLDIAGCQQWKQWMNILVRVKSVFGSTFINNFYIAHLLDLIISYVIGFILSFFITKKLSS